MDFRKTIQVLTITLACRLYVNSKLVLKGSKTDLSDGSEVLSFTCSSQSNTETPYAEFLVNNESIASSTYNAEIKECHFKHEEKNCGNVCKCKSDGRSHTWTFPMPSSSKITQYSCHMFINNNHRPEQASIIFNGTDFVNQKDVVDNLVSSTIPSKDSDGRREDKPIPGQSYNPGIYGILITILLLMICFLVFYIHSRSKKYCKESPENEREPIVPTQQERVPLITVTDTESPARVVETNVPTQQGSPEREVETKMPAHLESPARVVETNVPTQQGRAPYRDTESVVRKRSPGRSQTTDHVEEKPKQSLTVKDDKDTRFSIRRSRSLDN